MAKKLDLQFHECPKCKRGNLGYAVYRCKKCDNYWGCWKFNWTKSEGCKVGETTCPSCGCEENTFWGSNSELIGKIIRPNK